MILSEKMIDWSEIRNSDDLYHTVLKITGEDKRESTEGIESLLRALEGTKKKNKIALAREAKQHVEAHFWGDEEECWWGEEANG